MARRGYPPEFRRRVVELVEGGRKVAVSEAGMRARIRKPTEADEPQMVDLLSRVFDGWPAFEIPVSALEHLRWKMRSDPAAGRFKVRVAEQDEKILGYLVFKVAHGEAYVADLLALSGRTDVVRSLLEDALGLLRKARVELVTCWMVSHHPYSAILRRFGFIDSKRDVGFGYEPVGPDCADLEFLDNPRARIHLTHGDTDWI